MSKTLVIIDMLNDFVEQGAPLHVPGAQGLIDPIAGLRRAFHAAGLPVVYLRDAHAPNDPEFDEWPPHAVRGTRGSEVVEELAPGPQDILISKAHIDTFKEAAFPQTLEKLGTTRLYVAGVATEQCVLQTVLGAVKRGLEAVVVSDCVAGVAKESGDVARAQSAMREARAEFMTAREAAAELSSRVPPAV